MIRFDDRGREIPDSRPMELPANATRPESLQEMIRRMVQQHSTLVAQTGEAETLDEANDFDCEDEDEWENQPTQYTLKEEDEYVDADDQPDPAGQRGRADVDRDGGGHGDVPSERASQSHRTGPQRRDHREDAGDPRSRPKSPAGASAARRRGDPLPSDDGGEVEAD